MVSWMTNIPCSDNFTIIYKIPSTNLKASGDDNQHFKKLRFNYIYLKKMFWTKEMIWRPAQAPWHTNKTDVFVFSTHLIIGFFSMQSSKTIRNEERDMRRSLLREIRSAISDSTSPQSLQPWCKNCFNSSSSSTFSEFRHRNFDAPMSFTNAPCQLVLTSAKHFDTRTKK
jgi:hypothetical protein